MMDIEFVFVFIAFVILSCFNCRNSAKGMITEIGINERFYPKKYKPLTSCMRQFFNINCKMIPKFLYFELIISILFAILVPIYIMIYFCFDKNNRVLGVLWLFHVCLIIINSVYFIIMSTIFKHK